MSEDGSPYAAPKARIEEAPHQSGSVLAGFFLGWVMLLAGVVLCLGWFMLAIIASAKDSSVVDRVAPFGLVLLPLAPLAAGRWFWRRGRRDTANGIFMATITAAGLAGLLLFVAWIE